MLTALVCRRHDLDYYKAIRRDKQGSLLMPYYRCCLVRLLV
jgi:hypothetical protein